MSTNLKIARASLILITASVFGHAISLLKEMLVAYTFGVGSSMDAYYAAISVPSIINAVLVSTFGIVFIPIFIKHKIKNTDEANHAASIVINFLFVFLLLVTAALYFSAPWIMKYTFHGFNLGSVILTIKIFRIVCFVIILSGLIGIVSGILNSYEHFGWPAVTQTFITISTIIFILMFFKSLDILTLAYGLIVGTTLQLIFLIFVMVKKGYRYCVDFNWKHPVISEMASSATFLIVALLVGQMTVLVDRMMASHLVAGSIAVLGYADKLTQVPLLIFSGSIATAIFPYLSLQVAENKIAELKNSIESTIKMSGFIFIPLTVILIILSKPIIQFLFQRGAFTQDATELTSLVFVFYVCQLFFYTINSIFGRVYIALGYMKELLMILATLLGSKIVFNYIFMSLLSPSIVGIALATTVSAVITFLMYIIIVEKKKINFDWTKIWKTLRLHLLASTIMGSVVFIVFNFYGTVVHTKSFVNNGTRIVFSVMIGITVFVLLSRWLRAMELYNIIKVIKKSSNKFWGN